MQTTHHPLLRTIKAIGIVLFVIAGLSACSDSQYMDSVDEEKPTIIKGRV